MQRPHLALATDPRWMAQAQALRLAVLRAPWGQSLEADPTPGPVDDLILHDGQKVLATGRLFQQGQIGRVRGMAVAEERRGQGLGGQMLQALLLRARGRGCTQVQAHVREAASSLYLRQGFVDQGPGELLFDAIPHRQMLRPIDHADFRPWGLQARPAVNADRVALEGLIFGALAEYGMQPESQGFDRDLEDIESAYAQGIFEVLIDSQGQIQGSWALRPVEDQPQRLELRRMYLHPQQRARGLGRALLGRALALALERGCRWMELETATALKEARQLYQWAGFGPCGGRLETQRCDLRMEMRLSPLPDADAH